MRLRPCTVRLTAAADRRRRVLRPRPVATRTGAGNGRGETNRAGAACDARAKAVKSPFVANPFQNGNRKVVPASLIYARSNGLVLMLHRNADGAGRASDIHQGKWNGLGGKFELGESPLEASRREFEEEASIALPESAFRPLGVLQFPNFNPARAEDWIVFVFEAAVAGNEARSGLLRSSPEGDLHWIAEGEIASLPLWEGDREFLPWVLRREPFVGTFWYEKGALARSWLAPLGTRD